jgi:hypothetical protein
MNRTSIVVSLAASFICCFRPLTAEAHHVVVSGDVTPVFSLTNTGPNAAVAGNRQFFTNLLSSGDNVLIVETTNNFLAASELNEFYDSLPGVSVANSNLPITVGALSGVDLLIIPVPDAIFPASEVAAIQTFLAGSGRMFVIGESSQIPFGPATNSIVNSLLDGLAIPIQLDNTHFDIGFNDAEGAAILPHMLTHGVTTLRYGAASGVSGGQPLFLTHGLTPFMVAVPEPSTGILVAISLAVSTAVYGRKRRSR